MVAVLVLTLGPATAADPAQHRIADGIAVYLGVLPAEMIQGHGKAHAESGMHGGPRAGEHVYHVMVALFESDTGKRILDAEVKARVSELGLAGSEMPLEPMSIAGTVTYGNYFDLSGRAMYRIAVEIRRPGAKRPVKAEFTYDHRMR
ncbi:MAG: hypothetical protein ACREGL_10815 [Alphaproteobacteria bacterium]